MLLMLLMLLQQAHFVLQPVMVCGGGGSMVPQAVVSYQSPVAGQNKRKCRQWLKPLPE